MMKARRQSRPEPELLEERALLSTVAHPHHVRPARTVPAASAASHPVTNAMPLLGSVSGAYNTKTSSGVVGRDLTLSGSGDVTSLGMVQLTGVVHLSITRASSLPTGTLILSDSQGTIRLSLKGNGGPQPLAMHPVSANSMQMHYTIVSGTGAYRSLHGSGTLALSLGPDTPPTLPPTMPPSPIAGGPGSSNAGGGSGSSGGSSTGTGTGTGTKTPPPAPLPPVTITGGGGTGTKLPPKSLPPVHAPGPGTTGTGSPGQHGNGIRAVRVKAFALTKVPVAAPTFLKGHFTLVFNGSPSILPPPL
jgi:hypothetical protein